LVNYASRTCYKFIPDVKHVQYLLSTKLMQRWRNFPRNLPISTLVLGIFLSLINTMRTKLHLYGIHLSMLWILLSLTCIIYFHGAYTIFIFTLAFGNFFFTKKYGKIHIFSIIVWVYNIVVLIWKWWKFFSMLGQEKIGVLTTIVAHLYGIFCFNFVMLQMSRFGLDYHCTHGSPKLARR
jgi:hypothetical protein